MRKSSVVLFACVTLLLAASAASARRLRQDAPPAEVPANEVAQAAPEQAMADVAPANDEAQGEDEDEGPAYVPSDRPDLDALEQGHRDEHGQDDLEHGQDDLEHGHDLEAKQDVEEFLLKQAQKIAEGKGEEEEDVPLESCVVAVAAGLAQTCGALANGTMVCWGNNDKGQIAHGNAPAFSARPLVAYPRNTQATDLTVGDNHGCMLLGLRSRIRCWGANERGQLGDGSLVSMPAAEIIHLGMMVSSVAAGGSHTCAVQKNKTVMCWGANTFGQVGNNQLTDRLTPITVLASAKLNLTNVAGVTAGGEHTCAWHTTGRARCWGHNLKGQLGYGDALDRKTAYGVIDALGTDVVSMSAGRAHTCAVLANGTAACFGANDKGQLGDNTTGVARPAPVFVVDAAGLPLTGVVNITAGGEHTCALLQDGRAACWGSNAHGQLGDRTTASRPFAAPVTNVNNLRGITAGGDHTCILNNDTTAKCFGLNAKGQLGDGKLADSPKAMPVINQLNSSLCPGLVLQVP